MSLPNFESFITFVQVKRLANESDFMLKATAMISKLGSWKTPKSATDANRWYKLVALQVLRVLMRMHSRGPGHGQTLVNHDMQHSTPVVVHARLIV